MGFEDAKRPRIADDAEDDAVVDEDPGAYEEIEENLEKLTKLQEDLEKINDEASDKVLEVEQKYNEIRRPVYTNRAQIISSIPDFWLTTFANHPLLSSVLSEGDKQVFSFLEELDVQDNQDVKSGYRIRFTWAEDNPYFTDQELCKEFTFADDGTLSVQGTQIHWKPGMDLTAQDMEELNVHKRRRSTQTFFKWFSTEEPPTGIPDEIAINIKDDLWPNPLKYFNGESEDYGEEDEFDDEDEDDGAEFDDEGDEDEYDRVAGEEVGDEMGEEFDDEGEEYDEQGEVEGEEEDVEGDFDGEEGDDLGDEEEEDLGEEEGEEGVEGEEDFEGEEDLDGEQFVEGEDDGEGEDENDEE